MFSRCPALSVDADTTTLSREASAPEFMHRANRAGYFGSR